MSLTGKSSIAKFGKVSYEQFKKDAQKCGLIDEAEVKAAYDNIKIPTRSTSGSAGYDFYCPIDVTVPENRHTEPMPTGIRCEIEPGWVLLLVPRSGIGFKFGAGLVNTVGVIDQDYAYAANEGHIMLKLRTDDECIIHAGDRVMQGIFVPYGTAEEMDVTASRNGGFGSTGV